MLLPAMVESKKVKYIILFLLVVSFLVLRSLILLTDINIIDEYQEKYNGVLTKDIIDGNLRLSIFDYQYRPFAGGNTVIAFLALIPFLLFGESLISLKMVTICVFSLGTMIIWYFFICEYFNVHAGLLFGLLYTFSPPFFSKMNLMALGNHNESNLFSIIIIYLLYKLIYKTGKTDLKDRRDSKFKSRLILPLLFFGIASGFGIYFSYMCVIAVLVSLLVWVFSDRIFFLRKNFTLYLAGFIAGFLPWIIYNTNYHLRGIYYFIREVYSKGDDLIILCYPENLMGFFLKFLKLSFYHIPNSFGFQSWVVDIIYFLILLFFITLLFLKVLKYGFNCKENIFLIYPVVFLLAFTFSKFVINDNSNNPFGADAQSISLFKLLKYRYLIPLYPFLFSIIAVSSGKFIYGVTNYKLKLFSIICMIILLCGGLLFNLNAMYLSPLWKQPGIISLGQGLVYKGYDYYYILWKMVHKDVKDKKMLNLITTLEEEYRPRAYEIFGTKLGKEFDRNFWRITKVSEEISDSYKYYFFWGVGYGLAEVTIASNGKFEKAIESINNIEVPLYKSFCYESFGFKVAFYSFCGWLYSPGLNEKMKEGVRSYLITINNVPEQFKPFCFIGLGQFIGENIKTLEPICYERLIKYFDQEYMRFIYIGLGKELGEVYRDQIVKLFKPHQVSKSLQRFYYKRLEEVIFDCRNNVKNINSAQRTIVYEGIGLTVQKYFRQDYLINFILSKIDKEYREPLLKGIKGFSGLYGSILEEVDSSGIYYNGKRAV